jgi:hypothetical protein
VLPVRADGERETVDCGLHRHTRALWLQCS